MVQIIICGRKW